MAANLVCAFGDPVGAGIEVGSRLSSANSASGVTRKYRPRDSNPSIGSDLSRCPSRPVLPH
jgi:hypothetical protein